MINHMDSIKSLDTSNWTNGLLRQVIENISITQDGTVTILPKRPTQQLLSYRTWQLNNPCKYVIMDKRSDKMKDYKTILEEILEMLEGDLPTLKTEEAKKYVSNVIEEIKDSL